MKLISELSLDAIFLGNVWTLPKKIGTYFTLATELLILLSDNFQNEQIFFIVSLYSSPQCNLGAVIGI